MRRRPVANDLKDVAGATAWVSGQVAEAGIDEDVRYNIEVCVEETLANLVEHAHPLAEDKDIEIAFAADENGATIVVSDRCAPFDSTRETAPSTLPGGAVRLGGRGLRLMRAFASELTYRTCAGRNELVMRFRSPT